MLPRFSRFMRATLPVIALGGAATSSMAAPPAPWFTDATKSMGLDVAVPSPPYSAFELPDIITSGVALHDFDNDGDLDLYFTNNSWDFGKPHTAKTPRNQYLRHDPGGRFVDATRASGLAHGEFGMGLAVGDIDNDGDQDLFCANYGPDLLYRNRGNGTFEDISKGLNIKKDAWSCSAAFVDIDGDGFLDLSINQYIAYDSTRSCRDSSGRPDFCDPKEFPPLSDLLLRNNRDGTFTDVSAASGMQTTKGAALGVVAEDFNGDGKQDLYVANDGYANNLWINQGGGKFIDEALLLGCALNGQGVAEAGMGIAVLDADRDLDLDFFLTHLRNETNTIFVNTGNPLGFNDGTAASGLGPPSLPFTGFGTAAFDLELDGDLDLFVANGAVLRGKVYPGCKLGDPWKYYAEPKHLFINDGKGKFAVLGVAESGPIASDVEVSRGTAGGDLDGDGDFDLVVSNAAGPHRIYRNDAPRRGHWLIVRAVDPKWKRDALGAQVIVTCGGLKQVRTISSSWSYLSSSEPRAHFGLGSGTRVDSIQVRWPDGRRERFTGGPVDRTMTLERGKGTAES